MKGIRYVVATSQEEAEDIAEFAGHAAKTKALEHLKDVQSMAAAAGDEEHRYTIYKVETA